MSDKQDELQPIIVKKVKKGGGGHHGGAWKVAYADFVTAMMAFFLLLWLLNVTTSEQKAGIADYFDPTPKISESESGAGGIMGGLTVTAEGAMTSTQQPLVPPQEQDNPALRPGAEPRPPDDTSKGKTQDEIAEEQLREAMRKLEEERFKEAETALKQAMQETPELQNLAESLLVDMTPEGLRIQIVDQDGRSMFPLGSAVMYDYTQTLMAKVSKIIQAMPNEISIRGHTDGAPYGPGAEYTNWELSTDRANASRKVLVAAGLPEARVNNVVGKADTDHLMVDKPLDATNRRISIILLRQDTVLSEGVNKSTKAVKKLEEEKKLYKKSPGAVEFP